MAVQKIIDVMEQKRLNDAREEGIPWKKWGPYLSERQWGTFLRDANGRRPVYGGMARFHEDPHWKDYPLFYEYFHGDTGVGVGASHQTGWFGAIARIMHLFASFDAHTLIESGKEKAMAEAHQPARKK
jgi:hypothetical protein